jgi:hypothetical protein
MKNTWQQYTILAVVAVQGALSFAIHQGMFPTWTSYLSMASAALAAVLTASHMNSTELARRMPPKT